MSLGDRLLRIERRLERGLARFAGRPPAAREPFEIVPAIVDAIAERIEPAGGGARVFPYNRIVVRLTVPAGRADATRGVLAQAPLLEERVVRRLEASGCRPPADLRIAVKVVEGEPRHGEEFELDLSRRGDAAAEEPASRRPRVRLSVLTGDAGERTRMLDRAEIRIGRQASVVDRDQRVVRRNDLVFSDLESSVNTSVSRAHAHIEWVESEAAFRVFDDGSAQGTEVDRDGRRIEVPRRSEHGVRLVSGDVLCFGRARVKLTIEP